MNVYRMNRSGAFSPFKFTSNQCKSADHTRFFYQLMLVFDGDAPLNADKFFIDHYDLDKAIQNAKIAGSCEEMHPIIFKAVAAKFKELDLAKFVAYKCTIMPEEKPAAFMEYFWAKNHKSLKYLSI